MSPSRLGGTIEHISTGTIEPIARSMRSVSSGRPHHLRGCDGASPSSVVGFSLSGRGAFFQLAGGTLRPPTELPVGGTLRPPSGFFALLEGRCPLRAPHSNSAFVSFSFSSGGRVLCFAVLSRRRVRLCDVRKTTLLVAGDGCKTRLFLACGCKTCIAGLPLAVRPHGGPATL